METSELGYSVGLGMCFLRAEFMVEAVTEEAVIELKVAEASIQGV